ASYVLHRLLVPRHPPNALKHLQNKDARVHCAVLKQHTHSNRTPGLTDRTGSISENPSRSCLLPGKNVCSFRTQQCVDYFKSGDLGSRNPKRLPAHVSVPPMSTTGRHSLPKWLCHKTFTIPTLQVSVENAP